MTGKLILSDGTVFLGQSFGAAFSTSGEVVFNTGMVGYPESLTDPSYYGQILVLTYPLQGNYGVPQKRFWESERIQVKGLIVQNYLDNPSHFESQKTLGQWLKEEGVPALQGIDTRALTIKLREHGVMLGRVEVKSQKLKVKSSGIYDPNSENLFRSFVKRGVRVTRMPWDSDPLQAKFDFDGIFISNGPGDPKQAKQTIQNVKVLLDKNIPTFGICLGSQILALAAGGNTYKLKFGHRGQNQPVLDQNSKKAIITSQNHGFAVDMKSLGSDWKDWFVNLNDGTNEGIRHRSKPFMAVQFHPEASPGPTDASYLF